MNASSIPDKCYVYKIINKINDKVYIGSTVSIKNRFRGHRSQLKRNKHHSIYLQNEWNKYGKENFIFEVICCCPRNETKNYEQWFLNIHQSYDRDFGYNVNKSVAKAGGFFVQDDTRKKLSISHMGKRSGNKGVRGNIPWNKGIPCSKETILKIIATEKGRLPWNIGLKTPDEVRKKQSIKARSLDTRMKKSRAMKIIWEQKRQLKYANSVN